MKKPVHAVSYLSDSSSEYSVQVAIIGSATASCADNSADQWCASCAQLAASSSLKIARVAAGNHVFYNGRSYHTNISHADGAKWRLCCVCVLSVILESWSRKPSAWRPNPYNI